MSSRHYLASRMAETFACLAAFVSGTQDQSPQSSYEAAALAVKLCAPYLRVLEYEYGEQDEDCKVQVVSVQADKILFKNFSSRLTSTI